MSDDSCSTYFRTCGGLAAAAAQLASRAAAAAPALPGKGKAAAGSAPQAPLQRTQAALLGLLEPACGNEISCEAAAEGGQLLPAAAKLLGSGCDSVRAAAVRLLFTASIPAAPRGATCDALAAQQGAGLSKLLALLPGAAGGVQFAALALAGNCLTLKAGRDAAAALLAGAAGGPLLSGVVQLVNSGGSGAVQEKALALLGNMCSHEPLRLRLATDEVVAAVAAQAGARGQQQVQLAAAGALLNLCLEPAAQLLLTGMRPALAALLDAAIAGPAGGGVAERAAAVVARVARQAEGAAALEELGAADRLVDALAAAQRGAQQPPANGAWADAAVRALALLAARPGFAAGCPPAAAKKAVAVLAAACSGGGDASGPPPLAAGNAALALSSFAAEAATRPLLLAAGAVDALVAAMRAGRGGAVSRNAAVALAKAAAHAGALERLRELRAVEIMYEYVKP